MSGVLRRIFGDSAIGIELAIIRELSESFDLTKGETEDVTLALKAASEQIVPTLVAEPLQIVREN